ncbi:hypothetical protein EX895_004866 [Sporisorium graminicola]|uniref:tRNA-splicing endonuclease subunit Sen15 domain-containing protein n=1 Tax=Sporisorium graminicola TaxID=280036 RepID=A0A4U7KNW3_9BASI|nr:hypothetical protein EX895_004866 [Sporisorium graminicola]TKY86041.1 hypothetical protein EX895_004866 [Sporisorium graminicola]
MASASTSHSTGEPGPSLPEASSHQLSKRLQYDALLDAEAGTSSGSTSLGSPAAHPSYPAVAPLCRQYPTQASAIFQTYLDLKNGAAAWDVVEPLALSSHPQSAVGQKTVKGSDLSGISDAEAEALIEQRLQALHAGTGRLGVVGAGSGQDDAEELLENGLAAIQGRRKDAKSYEIVIPLTITQHLRPAQLNAIFSLIEAHAASCAPGLDIDTAHVLLAIIAPDSTLVYYVVSQGMVKPVN